MLFNLFKDIYFDRNDIIETYFTSLPYLIYNRALNSSNMALNGIGLGLIQCQKVFWFSNILVIFNIYLYIANNKYIYINISLSLLIICLYCINLYKTNKLINYLKIN